MFCSHNEVDLVPDIVHINNEDWVGVMCKSCKSFVGDRARLIDLVDKGIKRARAQREALEALDPDFEN